MSALSGGWRRRGAAQRPRAPPLPRALASTRPVRHRLPLPACSRCTALHTLSLNCALFDNEAAIKTLAALTTIQVGAASGGGGASYGAPAAARVWPAARAQQRPSFRAGHGGTGALGAHTRHPCLPPLQHLDLSNCCLTRVPRVLAALPALTHLTLNENDALGASEAALAPLAALTRLQQLEMRECGLRAVPAAIAGLTSLTSLLLGYNRMTQVGAGTGGGAGGLMAGRVAAQRQAG